MKCHTAFGVLSLIAIAGPASARGTHDRPSGKPIPCYVIAHGMGAVLDGLSGQPTKAKCDPGNPAKMSLAKLQADITAHHPADYMILAERLFRDGKKDDSVFWFYVGQLRFRIRLECHPEFPPSEEPALFSALHAEFGPDINGYAGGAPTHWIDVIQQSLTWDEANPDEFDPQERCANGVKAQHERANKLIAYIDSHRDEIRKQREENGLPNAE